MKTSKLIPAFVSTLPLMAILCSCSTFYLKKPADTNLDFWITERAERQEFEEKGCTLLPGWFGAAEYLDHRYVAEESGDMAVDPLYTLLICCLVILTPKMNGRLLAFISRILK